MSNRLNESVSNKPVAFSATLYNMDYDPDEENSVEELKIQDIKSLAQTKHPSLMETTNFPNVKKSKFSIFSCISCDAACINDDDMHYLPPLPPVENKHTPTSSTLSNTLYTSITPIPYQDRIISLQTKKPTWNSELQQYTHFFGGRVKIPSYRNFIVMHVASNAEHYQSAVEGPSDRVCIRHGQVSAS